MDQPVKKSTLLILRGVYPSDFSPNDTIFDKTVVEKKIEPSVVYTEMPKRFLSASTWIQFSNLKCWECDQMPIGYPKFIPENPEKDKDGNDICDVLGHFCEWNCAVRYALKELPKNQQWDALKAICLFESKFSGKKKEKIQPCPPKTLMKAYCGKNGLTPKQWRDKLTSTCEDYTLSSYKMEHLRELE